MFLVITALLPHRLPSVVVIRVAGLACRWYSCTSVARSLSRFWPVHRAACLRPLASTKRAYYKKNSKCHL